MGKSYIGEMPKIKCDQERTVYNHLKKKMAQGLPLTFLLLFLVN